MYNGDEKRRHERLSRKLAVIYRFERENRRFEDACRTLDLSAHGLALESVKQVALNTRLQLKVLIANRIVFCEGRVVHSSRTSDEQHRLGIELEEDASSALRPFLESAS